MVRLVATGRLVVCATGRLIVTPVVRVRGTGHRCSGAQRRQSLRRLPRLYAQILCWLGCWLGWAVGWWLGWWLGCWWLDCWLDCWWLGCWWLGGLDLAGGWVGPPVLSFALLHLLLRLKRGNIGDIILNNKPEYCEKTHIMQQNYITLAEGWLGSVGRTWLGRTLLVLLLVFLEEPGWWLLEEHCWRLGWTWLVAGFDLFRSVCLELRLSSSLLSNCLLFRGFGPELSPHVPLNARCSLRQPGRLNTRRHFGHAGVTTAVKHTTFTHGNLDQVNICTTMDTNIPRIRE